MGNCGPLSTVMVTIFMKEGLLDHLLKQIRKRLGQWKGFASSASSSPIATSCGVFCMRKSLVFLRVFWYRQAHFLAHQRVSNPKKSLSLRKCILGTNLNFRFLASRGPASQAVVQGTWQMSPCTHVDLDQYQKFNFNTSLSIPNQ